MRILSKISITATASVLLTMASCNSGEVPNGDVKTFAITIDGKHANRTNLFAFDLYHELTKDTKEKENFFVSPLSLHIALGMLLNGSASNTATEIRKMLHLEGLSEAEINQTYETLLRDLPKADSQVKLSIANSTWVKKDFAVESSFLNVMKQSFGAQAYSEDFSSDATLNKINQWASDNTNGKIKKVLDQLDGSLVMLLMNALYFKGDWKYQFDKSKTVDYPFHLTDGATKTVKMMTAEAAFGVVSREGYTAVQLPYGGGQFNLTLLLPSQGYTTNQAINLLGTNEWEQLQNTLKNTQKAIVRLPKFQLNYAITLNKSLQTLGMSDAFDSSNADLSKISALKNLFVSFVKQNTFLAVDEVGTEAAAVTTTGISVTSAGPGNAPVITFDRPFLFIISENTSNTIQFMGRIMNP